MSRERPVPHNFEDEQLESVFVGRRDGQARPTVLLIPTVMGVIVSSKVTKSGSVNQALGTVLGLSGGRPVLGR